jgi:predicted aspartyl protease
MGLFYVGCRVLNPVTSKSTAVRRLMVDTGAESTWINATALEAIGIERRKKDLQFQLANGQIITRSVGYAVLTVDKSETVDEVVFAETGDLQLLGARALEGLNLQVDSRRKRLVAAGPIVSAAAVPPRFARLVQVPPRNTENPWKDPDEDAEKASGHQIESSMSGQEVASTQAVRAFPSRQHFNRLALMLRHQKTNTNSGRLLRPLVHINEFSPLGCSRPFRRPPTPPSPTKVKFLFIFLS